MNTKSTLNFVYYGVMALYCAVVVVFGYLYRPTAENGLLFAPLSPIGQTLQYIGIGYLLLSVPGALFGFKQIMKKVSKIEDEATREKKYLSYAILRICLIGTGGLLNICLFYILGGYMSMLWCAAISLVAQYFCKPTEKKIFMEMNDVREDDPRMGEF